MGYTPFTAETLPDRLATVAVVTGRLGPDTARWQVREVGDGNLNLVFIVSSPQGALVVKQALPYVRLVGDSWPLPLNHNRRASLNASCSRLRRRDCSA